MTHGSNQFKAALTIGSRVEQQSTTATTNPIRSPGVKQVNTFGSAVKNVQRTNQHRVQNQYQSSYMGSFTPNASYISSSKMTNRTGKPKTSAYLARFDHTRDVNQFWQNIKDLSLN